MARKIEVEILGDSKSLERAFGRSADSGSKFGRALGNLAKVGVVAAGAAGVGAVFGVLKAGIPEFAEAAKVAAQTEAVIKSTGGSANVTAKQVDNLAQSMMRKTGIDDEAIAAGENMLLTFTNIRNETGKGNDVFNQSTRILADMSTALGTDMSKSAIQLGKALNDPVKGVTALTRVGVTFTAGQKAQIAAMVKAGDTMGAQKLILQELNKEFGGSAEAAGKTLPGQLNILKESFSNLAGTMVGALAPAFTSVVAGLTGFVGKLSAAEGAGAKFRVIIDGMQTVAAQAFTALRNAFAAIDWGQVWTVVSMKAKAEVSRLGTDLAAFVRGINWEQVGDAAGQGIVVGMNKLDRFIRSVDWSKVTKAALEGLGKMVVAMGRFLIGVDWGAVVSKMFSLLAAVIKAQATVLFTAAKVVGAEIIKGLLVGLEGIANAVRGKLDKARDAVVNAAKYAYGNALGVGKAIVNGIIGGLGGLVGRLKDAVESGIRSALSLAGRALPGSGPFEITRHIVGKPLAEGVVGGFERHMASAGSRIAVSIANAIKASTSEIANLQRQLDAISTAREAQDRAAAVRDAQTAVAEARKKGEGVAQAERDLARAREDIVTAGIQARLTKETAHLDGLKTLVEAKGAPLAAAFGKLGDFAKRAFEGKTANLLDKLSARFDRQIAKWRSFGDALTPAEKALAALDKAEGERSRNQDLTEATASGDPERIRQAQLAITRAGLEDTATVERTARDKAVADHIAALEATKARELQNLTERRTQTGVKLDEELTQLQTKLARNPGEYKKNQAQITKLLNSFGIDYRGAGENLGRAFANGLNAAQDEVRKSARALARIVAQYLETKSPTEKGPMATLDTWWKTLPGTLASGLDTGAMTRSLNSMATPTASVGAGSGTAMGGGTTVINYHFPNYLGSKQELTSWLKTEAARDRSRGGPAFAGV